MGDGILAQKLGNNLLPNFPGGQGVTAEADRL
jgi:hypothetical protein